MSARIVIEEAGLPLASLLAEIHAASFGNERWNVLQVQGSLELATTKAWIARDRGEATGFIMGQFVQGQAEILTVCVLPDRRQKGIGGILLRQAIAALKTSGGGKLTLEVAADNHAAKRLYEDHGFKMIGKRPNYYRRGAVTVDAVMYELIA